MDLLRGNNAAGYLGGQFLAAMPQMDDPRFQRRVIYICSHTDEGAMGLVINDPVPPLPFGTILKQLKICPDGADVELPPERDIRVLNGGPVEASRGFVLHSPDYMTPGATVELQSGIALTASVEVLKAIYEGKGPMRAVMALGYAGWGPGQLEAEIQDNVWINCPADSELLFDPDILHKYRHIFDKLGVDPIQLSSDAGHA